jgi:hypothetical protein
MKVPAPKRVPGRRLGWSEHELATLPYARFWNPEMADISADAHRAVAHRDLDPRSLPGHAKARAQHRDLHTPRVHAPQPRAPGDHLPRRAPRQQVELRATIVKDGLHQSPGPRHGDPRAVDVHRVARG